MCASPITHMSSVDPDQRVLSGLTCTDKKYDSESGKTNNKLGGRTGLAVRASDSGSGDPGSILGWVGVLFP